VITGRTVAQIKARLIEMQAAFQAEITGQTGTHMSITGPVLTGRPGHRRSELTWQTIRFNGEHEARQST